MFRDHLHSQHPDGFFTNWGSLSSKDFLKFKAHSITSSYGTLPPPPASSSTQPSTLSVAQQELNSFHKGVKHDPDVFLTLLKEVHFDKWLRSMTAQMQAQRVGNICTANYVEPLDPTELALDREKQTYMYSVFDKVVKTSYGMFLVTQHARNT